MRLVNFLPKIAPCICAVSLYQFSQDLRLCMIFKARARQPMTRQSAAHVRIANRAAFPRNRRQCTHANFAIAGGQLLFQMSKRGLQPARGDSRFMDRFGSRAARQGR